MILLICVLVKFDNLTDFVFASTQMLLFQKDAEKIYESSTLVVNALDLLLHPFKKKDFPVPFFVNIEQPAMREDNDS